MTQECKYNVENQGDKWQLTSFADIKVVSRIKQYNNLGMDAFL